MARPTRTDPALLAEFTTSGLATRAQLVAAGVASSTIARRCRPGGPWRRLLPGVIMLSRGHATEMQLVRAALMHAGPDAVLTGLVAARWHGVRRLPDNTAVHVLVPHGCHVASRDFVRVERTRRPPATRRVRGLPVAEPARAVVDAARRMDRLDPVRAMVADAVQRNVFDVAALAAELETHQVPGSALPRRILVEIADGVRSAAESWARALVLRSRRLPKPAWNMAIRSSAGRLLAVVDAWWDDVGLAWQIDSREFHLAPADYDATLRRHSALAAAGILVVHTLPTRLRDDATAVLDELARAYARAAHNPRPAVTATPWSKPGMWASLAPS